MRYSIMSPALDCYCYGPEDGWRAHNAYKDMKQSVLTEGSSRYGYVLVELQPHTVGWHLSFDIDWRHWDWWPRGELRWRQYVRWLIFELEVKQNIGQRPAKIVKDWLAEEGDISENEKAERELAAFKIETGW